MRPTAADLLLAAAALAAGVLLAFYPGDAAPRGDTVVVRSVKGGTVTAGLDEERTLTVPGAIGETVIEVGGGQVRFISSPCPHKVCVKRGPVSARGDYIVCVPNGVYASIVGESGYDAIVP